MGLSIDYKTKREFTIFHNFFKESRFHLLLSSIDEEIGLSTRLVGCNYCGGILHRADYPRSPIWISTELRVYYDERISFCCNNNKCRKRTTPPSVRFFGRIWVPGPLFIIISLLTDGISLRRIESIKRRFGMDIKLSTWMRWREWWLSKFPQTKFWQQNMGAAQCKKMILAPLVFEGTTDSKLFNHWLENCLLVRVKTRTSCCHG